MRYTYQLTKYELLELCIRAVAEQLYRRPFSWIILVLVAIMEAFLSPWALACFIGIVIAVYAFDIARIYALFKQEGLLKPRTVWIEDGFLKCSADGACSELALSRITVIRRGRRLNMAGYMQAKRRISWYPLPESMFRDREDRERFLSLLGQKDGCTAAGNAHESQTRPAAEAQGTDRAGIQEAMTRESGELLHFSWRMDEETWFRTFREVTVLMRAGTLGVSGELIRYLIIYGVTFAAAVCLWQIIVHSHVWPLAFTVFVLLAMSIVRLMKINPDKEIRRKLRRGDVQDDIYGNWEISVTDQGVENSISGRSRGFLPWTSFGYLVEAENNLFLFKNNRFQFIPFCPTGENDGEKRNLLKACCAGKDIQILKAREMKFFPGWAINAATAVLVLAAFAGGMFCVNLINENTSYPDTEYTDGDMYAAAGWNDTSSYVPLEEQVRVLKSLGMTVPEETVKRFEALLEAPDMRIYIEESPYVWLLTNLGVPVYEEDGTISAYSDQVFWFDFEGWDLSRDYINVLNGMLALAKDSPLSGVQNIREDISRVNWEEGSGELTVFFLYGGKEYSFQMEVENDWIDGNVLGIFNSILEQEQVKERFYVTGDGGQGAVVFYCLPEWAEAFRRATGLEIDALQSRGGAVQLHYNLIAQTAEHHKRILFNFCLNKAQMLIQPFGSNIF